MPLTFEGFFLLKGENKNNKSVYSYVYAGAKQLVGNQHLRAFVFIEPKCQFILVVSSMI